jgi:hypothetical protein
MSSQSRSVVYRHKMKNPVDKNYTALGVKVYTAF